ncbi:MAG TPA: sulfite exporter TauE/SafE family protein [Acidobacteriaceae bacterium]|nr:sulfite exporter TauE/SafE family protein [Acidobacteriaceae bacterium]
MQYLIGFVIAMFIALTGVGAGTITVPVLILFLGVPAPIAVGIGLVFASAVKLILVPAQVARKNVSWRVLGFMLMGGVPGVLVGSLFLKHLVTVGSQNVLNALLGAILVATASWQIVFSFRKAKQNTKPDRSPLLALLMLPVGAEVGFSSAGAGALGSAALLSFTQLEPAAVVGTDIAFGFLISLIGSGAHWFSGATNTQLLLQLIAGGVAGAIVGTMLSTRVPRRPLRFALWIWLLILGGQFLFNSYQAWDAPHKSGVRAPAAVHVAESGQR